MRLRNVKNAKSIVENSNYVINYPIDFMGKYNTIFNNDNPINVEIGMGKGDFIINMAKNFPEYNFIGIEKYESVLVRAIEKLEAMDLPNLKLINIDAINIDKMFKKEINTLYLNFSDPWPKKRHAKRRLTSQVFLELYENIFKNKKHIILKTDNIILFASSIENLNNNGYKFNKVSLDLHSEDIFNIETEYEKKFMSKGIKINYIDATK